MEDLVSNTARAIGFLSRLPVPARFFTGDDGDSDRMVQAFGIAGLIVTLPSAAILVLVLLTGAETYLAATAAIAAGILVTGALHEDGFADCADGLFGGKNRDDSLAIMRDSRVGTYGALALILSVALRIASMTAIASAVAPLSAAAILVAVGAASRVAMVWHWSKLPPARQDGLAVNTGKPTAEALKFLVLTGGGASLVLTWIAIGIGPAFVLCLAVVLSVLAFTGIARRVIQGHTGDTIGATQQLAEIAGLFGLALCL